MRILGLDYGSKRIGVAVCDELGITAQGLATITRKNRRQDIEKIAGFIRTYTVEKIVIGYPIKLDGTEGIQCEKVSKFARLLESAFSITVVKWDETLTTKEAEEVLIRANMRREKRKTVIDKLAAALILQGYLDSRGSHENIRCSLAKQIHENEKNHS
jgi:putative Holliday junction resolvase